MSPTLTYDNRFTAELPPDQLETVVPRQVEAAAFSRVKPTPVSNPTVIAVSAEIMNLLGLSADAQYEPWFVDARGRGLLGRCSSA